jgi:hypothetical protein
MLVEKGQGGFWWIVKEPLQFLGGGLLLAMLVFWIAGIGDQAWKDAPGGYGPKDEALANWLVRPLPCGLTPEQRIYGLTSAIGEPVEINLKHLRNGILDGDPDRVGVDFMADSEGLSDAPGYANIRLDTGGGDDFSEDNGYPRHQHITITVRFDPGTREVLEDLSYKVAIEKLTTGETPGFYMRRGDAEWIVAFYCGI